MDRRELLAGFGYLLTTASASEGQTSQRAGGTIFTHDLPDVNLHGWMVTAVEVVFEPGKESAAHRHPGITLAYVLEGEIVSKVGSGPEKTYSSGEMFIESPGELHAVSRNASPSKPARLLAMLLTEKGKPLSAPA